MRPSTIPNAKSVFGNKIEYVSSAIDCLKNADYCITVTEWEEFKKLKPENFTQNMRQLILIDGRRIYSPEEFSQKLKFATIGLDNDININEVARVFSTLQIQQQAADQEILFGGQI